MKNEMALNFAAVFLMAVGSVLGFNSQQAGAMGSEVSSVAQDHERRSRHGWVPEVRGWDNPLPEQGSEKDPIYELPREQDNQVQKSLRRFYNGRLIRTIYDTIAGNAQSPPANTFVKTESGELDFTPDIIKKAGNENKNYLVMVTASWCGPCRRMYPIMEELRKEGYIVYVFDITKKDFENFPALYNVHAFPTFIIFENGAEVTRKIGRTEKEWFTERLKTKAEQPDEPEKNTDIYDGLK